MVTKKFQTYESEVTKYHQNFRTAAKLDCPTLATVRSLPLENAFWDIGNLTHPAEPWAIDADTKVGIQAYLSARSCEEELRRVAREVRQMMRSSLNMANKLDMVYGLSTVGESQPLWSQVIGQLCQCSTVSSFHGVVKQLGLLNSPKVQKRLI